MKVPNARRTCLAALAVVPVRITMASARLAARGMAAREVVQEHVHLTALLHGLRGVQPDKRYARQCLCCAREANPSGHN